MQGGGGGGDRRQFLQDVIVGKFSTYTALKVDNIGQHLESRKLTKKWILH